VIETMLFFVKDAKQKKESDALMYTLIGCCRTWILFCLSGMFLLIHFVGWLVASLNVHRPDEEGLGVLGGDTAQQVDSCLTGTAPSPRRGSSLHRLIPSPGIETIVNDAFAVPTSGGILQPKMPGPRECAHTNYRSIL